MLIFKQILEPFGAYFGTQNLPKQNLKKGPEIDPEKR